MAPLCIYPSPFLLEDFLGGWQCPISRGGYSEIQPVDNVVMAVLARRDIVSKNFCDPTFRQGADALQCSGLANRSIIGSQMNCKRGIAECTKNLVDASATR